MLAVELDVEHGHVRARLKGRRGYFYGNVLVFDGDHVYWLTRRDLWGASARRVTLFEHEYALEPAPHPAVWHRWCRQAAKEGRDPFQRLAELSGRPRSAYFVIARPPAPSEDRMDVQD